MEKKKYIEMFGSFMEPFNYNIGFNAWDLYTFGYYRKYVYRYSDMYLAKRVLLCFGW